MNRPELLDACRRAEAHTDGELAITLGYALAGKENANELVPLAIVAGERLAVRRSAGQEQARALDIYTRARRILLDRAEHGRPLT